MSRVIRYEVYAYSGIVLLKYNACDAIIMFPFPEDWLWAENSESQSVQSCSVETKCVTRGGEYIQLWQMKLGIPR